jgi:hypothetical protein
MHDPGAGGMQAGRAEARMLAAPSHMMHTHLLDLLVHGIASYG